MVDSADIARYEDALRAYGISGSVYTVDELARELGVDSERARAACESLERRGAAALFGENGVKFAGPPRSSTIVVISMCCTTMR